MTDLIEDNLRHIKGNISKAAQQSGGSEKDVCLVAVSKKQPDERIDAALAAGLIMLISNCA